MGTMNAFYVGSEQESLAEVIHTHFPAATVERGNGFTGVVLATTDFEPPQEILAKLSSDFKTDVIWLAFQSVVDAFEFFHWQNGLLLRSLSYGCHQEERTWEEAAGAAEPWEKEAFFEDRWLQSLLKDTVSERQKVELERIWQEQELLPGRTEPMVSSKSAAWVVGRFYKLPGWDSPGTPVAKPKTVMTGPPPVPVASKKFQVQARLVPRYLWTSASIDVYLEGQCILMTGGQMKLTGAYASAFRDGGLEHLAELKWGKVRNHHFPYELWIDGAKVMDSQVQVENWRLGFIPATIIFLIMFGITFTGVFYLMSKAKQ